MADGIPPGNSPQWSNLLYLLAIAAMGWVGDWLRSRWQRPNPPPTERPHRRWDDDCEDCDEDYPQHHHHRDSDEDEEG